MKNSISCLVLILIQFLSNSLYANISLPKFFSNNMVLQRDMPIHVFGNATAGEMVNVTFNGQTASAKAENSGKWEITLPAMVFGGPYTLNAQGSANSIKLTNVLIGDVFICSGQSNMEFQLNAEASANTEIPASGNDNIRLITVPKNFNTVEQTDIPQASWLVCNPTSSENFSAVAYYFGKNIQTNLKIPVGLISAAWWATSIRSWMAWDNITTVDAHYKSYSGKTIEQASGKNQADYLLDVSGFAPAWPSMVYNGMISPFTRFPIKGAIWYQGEANTGEANIYKDLFQDMIASWRKKWGYDFGFFWVQLPGYGVESLVPQESQWAELREAQNSALSILKTGQAVITDLGDATNLHPTNKKDVGYRLAQVVLKVNYNQEILGSGPVYQSLTKIGSDLVLDFSNIGTGLSSKNNEDVLSGFEISGSNKVFFIAAATINGNKLTVSSTNVAIPVTVRYAWADNPRKANLVNSDGLLASPFRTDNDPPLISTIANFEQITPSISASWGEIKDSSALNVVDNPFPDVTNGSTKCLKVLQKVSYKPWGNGDWYSSVLQFQEVKIDKTSAYHYLHFKYFCNTATAELKIRLVKSSSEVFEYVITNPTLGKWVEVVVDLSVAAFQINTFTVIEFYPNQRYQTNRHTADEISYLDDVEINDSADSSTGISTNSENNIVLFPNPSNYILNVSGITEPTIASIFNSNGKLMRVEKLLKSTSQINLDGLSCGLYIIRLQAGKDAIVEKFVKL